MKRSSVLVAVFVVVVLLAAFCSARAIEPLAGFWSGDSEFLRAAGLSHMLVFVSPGGRTRDVSVVMTGVDGAAVANRNITLDLGYGFARRVAYGVKTLLSRSSGALHLRNVAVDNGGEVFPPTVEVKLDPAAGSLSIVDGDQLLAFLWRDNEASYDALATYSHQAE